MRWGGAIAALFLCLVVCLLVVAIRVRTLGLRRATRDVQRRTLQVEAERARLVRRIAWLRRRTELEARYRACAGGTRGILVESGERTTDRY